MRVVSGAQQVLFGTTSKGAVRSIRVIGCRGIVRLAFHRNCITDAAEEGQFEVVLTPFKPSLEGMTFEDKETGISIDLLEFATVAARIRRDRRGQGERRASENNISNNGNNNNGKNNNGDEGDKMEDGNNNESELHRGHLQVAKEEGEGEGEGEGNAHSHNGELRNDEEEGGGGGGEETTELVITFGPLGTEILNGGGHVLFVDEFR